MIRPGRMRAQRASVSIQSTRFATVFSPAHCTTIAPDGSDVRALLSLSGGSMAHFELASGKTSNAVSHRTVEEIWYVLSGQGEMWRKLDQHEDTVTLERGVCLTIPVGTHFQFRAAATESVSVVAVTMPPWPGDDEVVAVTGPWASSAPQK